MPPQRPPARACLLAAACVRCPPRQLAVEYLAHLRSAHALLLEHYNATIEAAEG